MFEDAGERWRFAGPILPASTAPPFIKLDEAFRGGWHVRRQ